jgi:LuxR family maltose regulon positive regulatory protein
MAGQTIGVEEKLQAAEEAMQNADLDDQARDLIGQISAVRATLAHLQYQPDATIIQAQRALEYLRAENTPFRSRATWALGFGYKLKGDRASARKVFTEAITQASGNIYYTVLATTGLGQIQESENQLHQAAESYGRSLQLLSDQGPPNAGDEFIGLARIFYEWNDLDAAEQHGQESLQLYDRVLDRCITSEVFLARLKLARGDVASAAVMLAEAEQSVHQHNFVHRIPEVAAAQVITLIHQGNLAAAAQLAQQHELPLSRARVLLAQGDPAAALEVLEPFRQQVEAKGWADEQLKAMILQAVALYLNQETARAVQVLGEALALAEPGGFIRIFVDEGASMAQLLLETASQGVRPDYISKLLAVFEAEKRKSEDKPHMPPAQSLIESLSQRELKIVQLIALGLSNREIGERLYLALDTVKGYNRRIFDKLQVQSRTEAIARAHELGLL